MGSHVMMPRTLHAASGYKQMKAGLMHGMVSSQGPPMLVILDNVMEASLCSG